MSINTLAANYFGSAKLLALLFALILTAPPSATMALSQDQKNVFDSGIYYFNADAGSGTCGGDTSAIGGGASGGSYSLGQVKTFASEPITSTWNISDSTVEHWFLKQNGAQPTITRYGLNSSNIGDITSTVKAANVSPIFFYLWTVNEVGGEGGFINHFVKEHNTGNGVKDAKADAEYMDSQSKIMSSIPSWIDAGNPVDFVPQAVKDAGNADFKKMPSGSIGRLYIAAGAAAAWEIYYPNGLKKEYNQVQNYATPLEDAMNNIKSMGGDPQQGGAALSSDGCTGVAGEGITKAINWAVMIAKNDGYGYDQTTPGDGRMSGWIKRGTKISAGLVKMGNRKDSGRMPIMRAGNPSRVTVRPMTDSSP